jgi:hypothetical protein
MGEPGRYTYLCTEKTLKWVFSKYLCKTRFNGRHGRRSTGRWKVGNFANGTGTAPVRRLPLSRCDGHGRQPYAGLARVSEVVPTEENRTTDLEARVATLEAALRKLEGRTGIRA